VAARFRVPFLRPHTLATGTSDSPRIQPGSRAGTYLSECLISVVRKTQLEFPLPIRGWCGPQRPLQTLSLRSRSISRSFKMQRSQRSTGTALRTATPGSLVTNEATYISLRYRLDDQNERRLHRLRELSVDPDSRSEVPASLGDCLKFSNRRTEAERTFRQALDAAASDSDRATAACRLAELHGDQKRTPDGRSVLCKTLRLVSAASGRGRDQGPRARRAKPAPCRRVRRALPRP
jgi:hypothetical protein